jgi:hypothetical protein
MPRLVLDHMILRSKRHSVWLDLIGELLREVRNSVTCDFSRQQFPHASFPSLSPVAFCSDTRGLRKVITHRIYSSLPIARALSTSTPTSGLDNFLNPCCPSPAIRSAVSCASTTSSAEIGMQCFEKRVRRIDVLVIDCRTSAEMSCVGQGQSASQYATVRGEQ